MHYHFSARLFTLTALAIVLFAAPAVSATNDLIDQNQPSGPSYMAAFSQTNLAQSFMQTNDTISGAGILLQPGAGSSDTVTIQLWDALPNQCGTMLAQASATGTAGQWVDVFWPPVNITPATTYYLVFTGNTSLGIAGSLADPYPYGQVFAGPGYVSFPIYDYAFRTYFEGCVTAADCTDDVFCNGAEQCESGVCVSGVEPCLGDEICNEASDQCQDEWDLNGDGEVDKDDSNILKLRQKDEKTALKEKHTAEKAEMKAALQ